MLMSFRRRGSPQGEAIDQLRAETRELKGVQEKLGRKERKAKELKEKNGALAEEHAELMQAYEASREQVRQDEGEEEPRATATEFQR